eukprot:scaffold13731_cov51-Attheya_sp.AAC.7
METSVDSIDAKVADVESDMQRHNVEDLEAFQTEVTPKIDQAITRPPASSDTTSLDARNYFTHFSGYIGTPTNLQKPVLADEYYKFVLPAGASDTDSYIDHQVQSDLKTSTDEIDKHIDATLQLSTDNCIDDIYTQVTSDFTGDIPVSPSKLEPVVALPTPPSPPTENMDFPRFSCYMVHGNSY